MSTTDPGPVVEAVARESYGRLVAYLASVTGDVDAAEDAMSEAFAAALRTWPVRGIPQRPDSWLVTAARRVLVDQARRRAVASRALPEIARMLDERSDAAAVPPAFPDRRLELLFACAHPAVDEAARSPLMLQAVLGLDAARIAAAFAVAPATMSQRLVRAKAKIRQARIPFRVPGTAELPGRLPSVLDAVYVAYGTGWDDGPGGRGLVDEAIRLAEIVVSLLPDQAEAHGLLALLLHSHARSAARHSPTGAFVPLDEQDTRLWDPRAMARGEQHLVTALTLGHRGPYTLQAAIQSVHNRRSVTGVTDVDALVRLYDDLVAQAPGLGALVARARVHGLAAGPRAALALLDEVPRERAESYQPYWVVRAQVLRDLGDGAGAAIATERAFSLTTDPAVAEHLGRQRG